MVVFLHKGMFRSIWAQVSRFYEGKWGWSPDGIMCRHIRACPWHVLSKTAGSVARRYQNQGMIDQTQSSIKLKHEYGHTFDTCHAVNTTGHNTSECTTRNFNSAEHTKTYQNVYNGTPQHVLTCHFEPKHSKQAAHQNQTENAQQSARTSSAEPIPPHPYSLHLQSLHISTLTISNLSTSLLSPSLISPHSYSLHL